MADDDNEKNIRDSDKRMVDYGRAEMNERSIARNIAGPRGSNPSGESALADVFHRGMNAAASSANDYRKRRVSRGKGR